MAAEPGADAAIDFSNGVAAPFPAGGHDVETCGCAPSLMTSFTNAGTGKGPDVSCATQAPVPPFDLAP